MSLIRKPLLFCAAIFKNETLLSIWAYTAIQPEIITHPVYIHRGGQCDISLMFLQHFHEPLPVFLALGLLECVHLTVPLPLQQILVLKVVCCQVINILFSAVHVYTFHSLRHLLCLPVMCTQQCWEKHAQQ